MPVDADGVGSHGLSDHEATDPLARVPAALGRREEHAAISRILERARSVPLVFVMEGEAGIGKSALWQDGVVSARLHGMTVVAAVSAHPSASTAFGVLGDLLADVSDDELTTLPGPQRHALEVALLRRRPGVAGVDWRAGAVGLRGLLADWGRRRPVLVAVDDLSWSDPSSLRVLEHVFRRLDAHPVSLFATVRTGVEEAPIPWLGDIPADRQHRVVIGPMTTKDLSQAIRERLDPRMHLRAAEAIAERAQGNPLLAMELARAAAAHDAGPSSSTADRISRLVGERLDELAPPTRRTLAVLAMATSPSVTLLDTVLDGDVEPALDEAREARLLVVDAGRPRFAHPLYGQAVRSALGAAEVRAIHRRLADTVDDVVECGRHLARATVLPDEGVAAALEHAAGTALARGGAVEASELAERALDLTPPDDVTAQVRRGLLAASAAASVHEGARTAALLGRLQDLDAPPPAWARVQLALLDWLDAPMDRSLEVLERIHGLGLDDEEVIVQAGVAECVVHVIRGDLRTAARVGRQALMRAASLEDAALVVSARATIGQVEDLMGLASGRRLLEEAVQAATVIPQAPGPTAVYEAPTTALGLSHMYADDLAGARELLQAQLERAVEAGQEPSQVSLHHHLAELAVRAGRMQDARDHVVAIQQLLGRGSPADPGVMYSRALVDAMRGRVDVARRWATAGRDVALQQAVVIWDIANRGVLGFLELSLGNPAQADTHLAPVPDMLRRMQVAPVVHPIAPDAIEAAVAVGDIDRADALAVELAARGEAVPGAWTRTMALRCRALVASARGDEALAMDALADMFELHGQVPDPHVRARSDLVAGIIHRRAGNRGLARDHLEGALARFEEVGTPLWADRAREELARVSGRPRRSVEQGLTATEEQVAGLAMQGLTNREIAARLFVSPKTVEHNLTRIYRKLGVRSRTELAASGVMDVGSPNEGGSPDAGTRRAP